MRVLPAATDLMSGRMGLQGNRRDHSPPPRAQTLAWGLKCALPPPVPQRQAVRWWLGAGSPGQPTPAPPRAWTPALPAARCTDHDGIVVGAADPQNHSRAQVFRPPLGQGDLPFIPHPADKTPQLPVLAHVVEAGGHGHVQGRARLRRQGGDRVQTTQETKGPGPPAILPAGKAGQHDFSPGPFLVAQRWESALQCMDTGSIPGLGRFHMLQGN